MAFPLCLGTPGVSSSSCKDQSSPIRAWPLWTHLTFMISLKVQIQSHQGVRTSTYESGWGRGTIQAVTGGFEWLNSAECCIPQQTHLLWSHACWAPSMGSQRNPWIRRIWTLGRISVNTYTGHFFFFLSKPSWFFIRIRRWQALAEVRHAFIVTVVRIGSYYTNFSFK